MVIYLCHIKMIIFNHIFFADFVSVCSKEKLCKEKHIHQWISLFMVNMMVQILILYVIVFVSYSPFVICFLYTYLLLNHFCAAAL